MKKTYTFLHLLLCSSSVFAHPFSAPNVTDFDAVKEPTRVTSPSHVFDRRSARPNWFMKDFVKGVDLWGKYFDKMVDLDATDSFTKFPFDLNPIPESTDSPAKAGWKLESAEDSSDEDSEMEDEDGEDDKKMEWVEVEVDRDGWRYEEVDIPSTRNLQEAIKLTKKKHVKLTGFSCREWRNPNYSLIAYIDCANGIFVGHNADFKTTKDGPSKHRWSDVSWMLWTTECPNYYHHNLQYFVRETITNEDTEQILEEAAIGRGRFNTHDEKVNDLVSTVYTPTPYDYDRENNQDPTCDQNKGACDFYTMLRAPNVIGVVYLLMAHVKTLSNTYISQMESQSLWVQDKKGNWKTRWNLVIKLDQSPC